MTLLAVITLVAVGSMFVGREVKDDEEVRGINQIFR